MMSDGRVSRSAERSIQIQPDEVGVGVDGGCQVDPYAGLHTAAFDPDIVHQRRRPIGEDVSWLSQPLVHVDLPSGGAEILGTEDLGEQIAAPGCELFVGHPY